MVLGFSDIVDMMVAEWEDGEEDKSAARLFHKGAVGAISSHSRRDLQLRDTSVRVGQHFGSCCAILSVARHLSVPCQVLASLVGPRQQRRCLPGRLVMLSSFVNCSRRLSPSPASVPGQFFCFLQDHL
jgi:hypothetical protein